MGSDPVFSKNFAEKWLEWTSEHENICPSDNCHLCEERQKFHEEMKKIRVKSIDPKYWTWGDYSLQQGQNDYVLSLKDMIINKEDFKAIRDIQQMSINGKSNLRLTFTRKDGVK